jgi:hypothetical protein
MRRGGADLRGWCTDIHGVGRRDARAGGGPGGGGSHRGAWGHHKRVVAMEPDGGDASKTEAGAQFWNCEGAMEPATICMERSHFYAAMARTIRTPEGGYVQGRGSAQHVRKMSLGSV